MINNRQAHIRQLWTAGLATHEAMNLLAPGPFATGALELDHADYFSWRVSRGALDQSLVRGQEGGRASVSS